MEKALMENEATGKLLTKDSMCPSLSYKQRLYGFLFCMLAGVLISVIGFILLFVGQLDGIRIGLLMSLGNIISVASTFFLFGPCSQVKKMFEKKRIIATIVFLVSLIATLILVFSFSKEGEKDWKKIVLIVLIIVQYIAFFWYCLSYIPYGQKMLEGCVKCCFCS